MTRYLLYAVSILIIGCQVQSKELEYKKGLTQQFKNYWYDGTGEISSYKLEQARYGEIRDGHAVLVYVTEPFLANKQVKADDWKSENAVSVLKLNRTKKFLTGIYPYSVMSSIFYPVESQNHSMKITNSMQEWCGHVFAQLNNREDFEIQSYSYFESQGDQKFALDKNMLEDDLWMQARIDPESLPVGDLKIIPSFEFTRLRHKEFKAHDAQVSLTQDGQKFNYKIEYPALERTLTLFIGQDAPFEILGWEETYQSGFGKNAKFMTTKASKIETIKSAYWGKNSNQDLTEREKLGLPID